MFNCKITEEKRTNWESGEEVTRFILEPIEGFKVSFDDHMDAVNLVFLLGEISRITETDK